MNGEKIQQKYDFLIMTKGNKNLLKNWVDQEISGKITVFDLGKGCNFWFELSGGSKSQGFEKSGFHGM